MMTPHFSAPIPISLYVHIPWCVKKCPYCDFNSHVPKSAIDEEAYIDCLLADLDAEIAAFPWITDLSLQSIFFGGGTPSLFHAKALGRFLQSVSDRFDFSAKIEITLEANPGTIEHDQFHAYRAVGINRISLGVQSFQQKHLKNLGRIHSADQAHVAITQCLEAQFTSLNCDLMHGLEGQTATEACIDLQTAINKGIPHISWYQLTIEQNTLFYKQKPPLPCDEALEAIELAGLMLLQQHGYERYEISAYALPHHRSVHNQHYWEFGDYIGIGAGAHGKLTDTQRQQIIRRQKSRLPKDYINAPHHGLNTVVPVGEIPFEYLLNRCRLFAPIQFGDFTERTGLSSTLILPALTRAEKGHMVKMTESGFDLTAHGRLYLNDFLELFV